MAENTNNKKKPKKKRAYSNIHTPFKFLMPGKKSGGYREYLETIHVGEMDVPFLIVVLLLLSIGLIMMYSASYAWAIHDERIQSYDYYFKRQLGFAIGGLIGMAFIASPLFDYHIMKNPIVNYGFFGLTTGLLLVTALFGDKSGGATRWITIGGIQFQPSEFSKIALVMLFAHLMSTNSKGMKSFKTGMLPYLAVIIMLVGIMALQPHLSGAIIIATIGFAMMFAAGANIVQLLLFGLMGGAGMTALAYFMYQHGYEFIKKRVDGWLHTFEDGYGDIAWQTRNSLIAIGSGGWFGLGFGQSRQKYLYLPESQNDFVFSIVCEELGFVGALAVILLFVLLIARGVYIACHSTDKYGFLLTTGLIVHIGLQAFLNMAVVSNAMPNTGISLPFFSYGGTALVLQLLEMGVVLNISRQSVTIEDADEEEGSPPISESVGG